MKQNYIFQRTLSALLLLMASSLSWAYDFKAENADGVTIYYKLINNGTEAEVTYNTYGSASYFDEVINIPSTVAYDDKTLSVTSIGYSAFGSCISLTSVTIPEGVTSIGNEAFAVCISLTSVTIPEGVTSIGNYAFQSCSGLTSIVVDDNNPVYDSRNNCNAIIETASNALIQGCSSTIIPESVTSIGESAFEDCSGLTSIDIPNSVTSIGDYTFWNCSSLTSVTIPESVTSIGGWAFQSCSGLTSVTIPNSVTSIGSSAFANCI